MHKFYVMMQEHKNQKRKVKKKKKKNRKKRRREDVDSESDSDSDIELAALKKKNKKQKKKRKKVHLAEEDVDEPVLVEYYDSFEDDSSPYEDCPMEERYVAKVQKRDAKNAKLAAIPGKGTYQMEYVCDLEIPNEEPVQVQSAVLVNDCLRDVSQVVPDGYECDEVPRQNFGREDMWRTTPHGHLLF